MAHCQETFKIILASGDEEITLVCDLEQGHNEIDHFDQLLNLCWCSPDALSMAKKIIPPIVLTDVVWRDLVTRNGNT